MCNGFHFRRESLKIKAFYIHFSSHPSSASLLEKALHDFLTLRFLPRMINDPLEIDGSTIRSDKPAFLTLHRVVCCSSGSKLTEYGSRDHVKASDGVRFEIYNGDSKVLKGVIRKDEQGGNWKLECKGGLDIDGVDYAKEAHVEVAIEVDDGRVEFLNDKVKMRSRVGRNLQKTRQKVLSGLEEIPEEELESDGSCCCDCDCGGGTTKEEEMKMDGEDLGEMEMESVSWAVDAAILVVSLGVGYLLSRASSSKKLVRLWR